MRRNLFWKLALTFIALLAGVLLAADFFAERALYRDSERATFRELAIIARYAQSQPPEFPSPSTQNPEDTAYLKRWVRKSARTACA